MADAQLSPFGQRLRRWRKVRRMSQLDLANAAGASPRHISFIETGRSRPGEDLVIRLAETLEVPLRERNELLVSAGLSPLYDEDRLDDEQLAPFMQLIEQMLERHDPYPALVIDRWWNLVRANKTAVLMFGELAQGSCLVDIMLGDSPITQQIVNFGDVAWATVDRLRGEAAEAPDDERLQALVERAEQLVRSVPAPSRRPGPVICPVIEFGGQRISTVTTIARFGATRSVTLDELRVELIYPTDEASAAFFRMVGGR